MTEIIKMVAKTQFGLEEVLAEELRILGAEKVEAHNRAVSFEGDLRLMYKANLYLRTALKVLIPIAKFKATNERDLYEEIRRMQWDQYLDVDGTLAIHSSVKSDFFNHSQYISQKTKDAIVDGFRDKYGRRPSVDLTHPDLSIDIHIFKDDVTVSLDSSAESLHRRGYRGENTLAPINEVTAAGMILLTGWDGIGNFVDPMCGSGTLLIEAALYAKNVPANWLRKQFGFERWKNLDAKIWQEVKDDAQANIRECEARFFGSDKTFKAIDIARGNVERAGLDEDIRLSNKRFEEVVPPAGGGILIMNPPYGERLPIEEINAFYKMMGDKMKKDFKGYTAWIISSNIEAMKKIGLAASKRLNLYNGALECKYHKFELYEGSRSKPKPAAEI
ncbi:MAG: THUMP domain-containing protein [Bacteroidia bacterium]